MMIDWHIENAEDISERVIGNMIGLIKEFGAHQMQDVMTEWEGDEVNREKPETQQETPNRAATRIKRRGTRWRRVSPRARFMRKLRRRWTRVTRPRRLRQVQRQLRFGKRLGKRPGPLLGRRLRRKLGIPTERALRRRLGIRRRVEPEELIYRLSGRMLNQMTRSIAWR